MSCIHFISCDISLSLSEFLTWKMLYIKSLTSTACYKRGGPMIKKYKYSVFFLFFFTSTCHAQVLIHSCVKIQQSIRSLKIVKKRFTPPSSRFTTSKASKPTLEKLHQKACEKKQLYYIDPNSGLKVMTSYLHQKRGTCCQSQCRHCPYDKKVVS